MSTTKISMALASCLASCLVLGAALSPSLARAGEGHDHGDAPPAATGHPASADTTRHGRAGYCPYIVTQMMRSDLGILPRENVYMAECATVFDCIGAVMRH